MDMLSKTADARVENSNSLKHSSSEEQLPLKPKGFGIRHQQVILMFSGLFIAYALRVNLSIGIVAMVDNTVNPDFLELSWTESTRSLLLSSFFWGYIVMNVPASQLAQRYGAKLLLAMSLSICAVMTLISPIAATAGWEYLCAVRVVLGAAQGFVYPGVHTLLARWVHPSERGFLSTFTYSGTQLGTVFMLAVSGSIASSSIGWPGIFYVSGGLTAVWVLFWLWLGCDAPAVSHTIGTVEKRFIESARGCATTGAKKRTPWLDIAKSKPFWAILAAHCAQNWGFWTLLTEIPSYMKDVLHFDIKSNSLLSAMPYFVMWVLCSVFSEASDLATNRKYLTVGVARKLLNSIGLWLPALALIALGYVPREDTTLAVVMLTLAVGLNAAGYVGYLINHMDLSPNFAGSLMGLTNGISNIMSLLGPLFVGIIVTDEADSMQWRVVFFVSAGVFIVGNLVFVIFGSATIQPWNATADDNGVNTSEISGHTDTAETLDIEELRKI